MNHYILMTRIGQRIRDKRVLRLIGRYLRSGVRIEGVVEGTEEGSRKADRWRRFGALRANQKIYSWFPA